MPATPKAPFELFAIDHLLSEEERAIRDVVRAFVEAEIKPNVAEWFEDGQIPGRELMKKLGDLGVLGRCRKNPARTGGHAVDVGLTDPASPGRAAPSRRRIDHL